MTSHLKKAAGSWPVQDAKAKFSEFLDASVRDGPQIVTRRGVDTAVLVPIEEWQRLNEVSRQVITKPQRTLKQVLLAEDPRFDLDIDQRGTGRWRKPPAFD